MKLVHQLREENSVNTLPNNIKTSAPWGSASDAAHLRAAADLFNSYYVSQLLRDIAVAIDANIPFRTGEKVIAEGRRGVIEHLRDTGIAWVVWDDGGDWLGSTSDLERRA